MAATKVEKHAEKTADMFGRSCTHAKYVSISLTEYGYLPSIGQFCEMLPYCLLIHMISNKGRSNMISDLSYPVMNSTVSSVERVLPDYLYDTKL